jgi:hypothetical protein
MEAIEMAPRHGYRPYTASSALPDEDERRASGRSDLNPPISRPIAPKLPPPLWLCIHEAAHAVAHFVLNERLPRRYHTSVLHVRVGDGVGNVRVRQRCGQRTRHDAIRCLAGYVAENRFLHGPVWRPAAADFANNTHLPDIRAAADAVVALDPPDPSAELLRLWQTAHDLVAREWIGIVRVAWLLRQRGAMTGAEFEEAWRARRCRAALREQLDRLDDA